jgi:hypothetical protein
MGLVRAWLLLVVVAGAGCGNRGSAAQSAEAAVVTPLTPTDASTAAAVAFGLDGPTRTDCQQLIEHVLDLRLAEYGSLWTLGAPLRESREKLYEQVADDDLVTCGSFPRDQWRCTLDASSIRRVIECSVEAGTLVDLNSRSVLVGHDMFDRPQPARGTPPADVGESDASNALPPWTHSSSGGCSIGCACGDACIDCSKTCRLDRPRSVNAKPRKHRPAPSYKPRCVRGCPCGNSCISCSKTCRH